MKPLIQAAVRRPVATTVGVLLVTLFGALAVSRIPVQLTPVIDTPRIEVTTSWAGASPQEVEREIVERQEERLKDLEGLVRLESSCAAGVGTVSLSYRAGADIEAALVQVANRLQQVRDQPVDAERPVVEWVGTGDAAVAWFMLVPGGAEPFAGDITTLGDLAEDVVRPALERVPGVARVEVVGARRQEMQVVADPARLSARGVTLQQMVEALELENRNFSGGEFDEGKRRYTVRTTGAYRSAEEIEDVVVAMRGARPVSVGDVATVRLGYDTAFERGYFMGAPTLGVRVQKRPGADVLDLMDHLRAAAVRLDAEALGPRGLRLEQSYDETEYIRRGMTLVSQSLLFGCVLAVAVLLLFLRSQATTLVVAVAIPVSVLGTFLMLALLGRTLNVISMAGVAFAVGMVVDNSIVVIENIYRLRQMGKSRRRAAVEGTREVSGAIFASTLTTIAVFLPILFIEADAGRLFRDLAVAISCAVGWSLLVALTLIPSLSARLLETAGGRRSRGAKGLWGGVAAANRVVDGVSHGVYWLCGGVLRRVVLVIAFTLVALGGSWLLLPEAEYLPAGNRNFLFGVLVPPAGNNLAEAVRLHDPFLEALEPLWRRSGVAHDLPGGGVRNFFFVATPDVSIFGLRARSPERVRELLEPVQGVGRALPDALAFVEQTSIFEGSEAQGRNLQLDVTGPELDRLMEIGSRLMDRLPDVLPEAQARPVPDLELRSPEVRVVPDRRRAAELGLSNRELGVVVNALVDGVRASHYHHEGREIDLVVNATDAAAPPRAHLLEQLPIATPRGRTVTLGAVAEVFETAGPTSIRRLDRSRAVTLEIQPPPDMPLRQAMSLLEEELLDPLRGEGTLGGLYRARLSGSADQLVQISRALTWDFLLALLITYLLMAALFESFLHPLVILFSVPLAALGGVLGLATLNLFVPQSLDVLTMLGFIILIGTVVNNAILIVHQALNHRRLDEMSPRDAVTAATRNRVRPIFMSVATSVFGMLPLICLPGAGSELYRGLGSVVVGGLLMSTAFTLILVPSLLSLVLEARGQVWGQLRRSVGRWGGDSRHDTLAPSDGKGVIFEPSGSGVVVVDPSGTIDLH
ncbi:MAG: efflux RND transporter permease subunit [Acidobacteriota bacterium]